MTTPNVTDRDRQHLAEGRDSEVLRSLADVLENGPRMDRDSDMPFIGIESEWAKELGKRLREISERIE